VVAFNLQAFMPISRSLDRLSHPVPASGVGRVEHDPISGPQPPPMDAVLLVQEVDDLTTCAEALVVAEIVVEAEGNDSARQEQEADLASADQMDPALRSAAVFKVVVEVHAKLALIGNGATESILNRGAVLSEVFGSHRSSVAPDPGCPSATHAM
jgi:hypothetical protein